MRILVIAPSVLPLGTGRYGGAEKMLLEHVDGLLKFGQEVTVAAPEGSRISPEATFIPTVKLPLEQDHDELAIMRMDENSQHQWIHYDVIHDFSHTHAIGKTMSQLPAVFNTYDPIVTRYNKSKYNVLAWSEWQKARFERLYSQKCLVMPQCVNTDIYKPISNPARERFLFLGKISPEKGVHLAIRYARELGVPLDVVGGLIPSEQGSPYLQTIKNLCDGERVKLYFNVTEEEKVVFLQNARALIYPVQQDEAHWLTGMEAWCIGLPTITFARGSFPEVCPFVVRTEDDFKAMMGFSGWYANGLREWATNKYSVDTVIPRYIDLYRKISEGYRW